MEVITNRMGNRTTIFDDVFRTMIEYMPQLIIPLINEVFHTDYGDDVEVVQLRNEQHGKDSERIMDTRVVIQGIRYHIECQTNNDGRMVIRMFQYDIFSAIENCVEVDGEVSLYMDYSCVLYLRENSRINDYLKLNLIFPNNQKVAYEVPTVKLFRYTKDEIFQKKLFLFLPYYILRYEKQADNIEENSDMLSKLLEEYTSIYDQLYRAFAPEKEVLYSDMVELIQRIFVHVFRNHENVRKELSDMGGRILELESRKNIRLGREVGHKEGLEEGLREGLREGREVGELMLSSLINRLILDNRGDDIGCAVSDKEFRKTLYEEYGIKAEDYIM